jgi:hypothetical protein
MIRLLSSLFAITSFTAPAQPAPSEPSPTKPKLALLPFAALTGDVPQRAGAKAAGMFLTELKSADNFTLLDLKREKSASGSDEALETARKEVTAAQELRAKKKFRLADEALQRGLVSYKAGLTAMTDVGELVDAYALLAAIQFTTGRDEEATKSLHQALTLAPDRELPLAQTSAQFSRVVAAARQALKEGPKGSLLVESAPANAPLTLDGMSIGATPLLIQDVPPGLHVWKATLPSGEAVAGVVEVIPGKQAAARAASSSKDPESRVLSSLAQNRVDPELLTAVKEHAKTQDAELVVFGALSRDGKGLALDTFLFASSNGALRRLARTSFDTELLSAGMEFYNLAGELAKKGAEAGEAIRVPASVSMSLVAAGPAKQAEVKYGVIPGQATGLDEAPEPTKDEPRKPLDQKRRPLKRQ